jgi:hypothetical protein
MIGAIGAFNGDWSDAKLHALQLLDNLALR